MSEQHQQRVLLAHNDRIARETLARDLTGKGYAVRATSSFDTLWRWIRKQEGDLILIDVDIPDPARNGFELLKQIRQTYPHLPAMVLSAENTVLTSLLAARFDATDYFPKPFSFAQLSASIARALQTSAPGPAAQNPRTNLPLVGSSAPMQEVYRTVAQAAQSDLPVLITGETGTGKSLIASVIHDFGAQAQGEITVLHFPLSDEALGQALKTITSKGSVLVEEVSALTEAQNAQLIGLLSRLEQAGNCPRLIATTGSPLSPSGGIDGLSPQLQFRLNTMHLALPPLRDREADVDALATAFVAEFSQNSITISPRARRSLLGRAWPGNVRELKNLIQRAVLSARGKVLDADDVRPSMAVDSGDGAPGQTAPLEAAIARALAAHMSGFDENCLPPDFYQYSLAAFERPLLKRVMAMVGGNQLKAAALLGINRNTLHKKLVHYDLRPNMS